MALPTGENVYRAVGRLAVNCTDFAIAYPHGGTALGTSARIIFDHGNRSWPDGSISAHELGGRTVEVLELQDIPILSVSIRGWDDDQLALFWSTVIGPSSGKRVIELPGDRGNGYQLSRNAVKITFSPYRAAKVPAIHFYRAVPVVDEESSLHLRLVKELAYIGNFVGLDNDSGKAGQMGLLEDLTV